MLPRELQDELPSLVDLKLADQMVGTTKRMGRAWKAISEIRLIEDALLAEGRVPKSRFRKAMSETAAYARIIAKDAEAVAKVMRHVKAQAVRYLRENDR